MTIRRARLDCGRPIRDHEIHDLQAMGFRLRSARSARGLSQRELAEAASLSRSSIERIEAGARRTRRSTLQRIVAALGEEEALIDELAALAGHSLAPESEWRDGS